MSNFKIEWVGKDELGKVFEKAIKKHPEALRNVIRNNAESMKAKARVYAPKDTHFLKDNIVTKYPSDLSAEIHSGASYAGYQEWGTRYQSGTPHIRPAFNDTIPNLEQDINDVAKGLFK